MWGDWEVSDCPCPDPVVGLISVSFPNSKISFCVSQTLCLCVKRSASGTLVCDQMKKKMNVDAPVKAVPEKVRGRPTPQSALFTAVPGHVKNGAPPAPEEAHRRLSWKRKARTTYLPQQEGVGFATPVGRIRRESSVECEGTRFRLGHRKFLKKSENILVLVHKLECFLLDPTDVAGVIMALAAYFVGGWPGRFFKSKNREVRAGHSWCRNGRRTRALPTLRLSSTVSSIQTVETHRGSLC